MISYGPPRYSDDLDVVLPGSAAPAVRAWLIEEGFKLEKHSVPNSENAQAEVERYERDLISLDLLMNAVRGRHAKVDVPEAWIAKGARRGRLVTMSSRTAVDVPIARPEAIWALKLQAGRPRDISDLFAIAATPIDTTEIADLFVSLKTDSLVAKLLAARASVRIPKTFVDSLSRRQLGKPSDPANIQKWTRFESTVDSILRRLDEGAGTRPP